MGSEIKPTKMRKRKPLLSEISNEMSIQAKSIVLSARPVKPKPVVSTPPTPTKKLKKPKSNTATTGPISKVRKLENDETTCPICLGKNRKFILLSHLNMNLLETKTELKKRAKPVMTSICGHFICEPCTTRLLDSSAKPGFGTFDYRNYLV